MSNILVVSNTDGAHYVFRGWLIEKLTQDGHCVDSLTLRLSPEKIYKEKIDDISNYYYRIETEKINLYHLVKSLKIIRDIVNSKNYDIVHLYGHEAFLFFWPFIRKMNGVKIIVTLTGLGRLFSTDANVVKFLARKLLVFLYRISLKRIYKFIFLNSDDEIKINKALNCKVNSVVIRGEGYLDKSVVCRSRASVEERKIKVLFASRFLIEKGILILIDSIKLTTNLKLEFILAGTIPEQLKSNLLISQLLEGKVQNAKYIGHVQNIPELLNEIDVVILPTFYNEGAPRILIEALCAGKFIITTDAPGAKETVLNNLNGITVKRKSVKSLVNAMNRIDWEGIEKAKNISIEHFYNYYSSLGVYQVLSGIYFHNK